MARKWWIIMTIEKIWRIEKLDVSLAENGAHVVTRAHWECTGTDGEFSGRVFKFIDLDPPNFDSFTNYTDLAELQVIGWIHEKMGAEAVAYWEELVDIQIEKQHRPKQDELELPWK